MRRRHRNLDSQVAGQDSFLDIVANMVGILIILVTVVGVRAGRSAAARTEETPETVQLPPDETLVEAVQKLSQHAASVQAETTEIETQAVALQQRIAERKFQQELLATHVARTKQDLQQLKSGLTAEQRADWDLRQQLDSAQDQLAALQQDYQTVAASSTAPLQVQNLPTPLSQTVHGPEIHLQLRDRLVSIVPMDLLLEEYAGNVRSLLSKLQTRPSASATFGPLDGFRIRFTLTRSRRRVATRSTLPTLGVVNVHGSFEMIPVAEGIGDPVDVALASGSRLRSLLARPENRRATITAWIYPDSFSTFRSLKAALHAEGLRVAARPLPHGRLIGGSDRGSKSVAQ